MPLRVVGWRPSEISNRPGHARPAETTLNLSIIKPMPLLFQGNLTEQPLMLLVKFIPYHVADPRSGSHYDSVDFALLEERRCPKP